MKTFVFLANRFIKAHKLSALLSVIIISLFIAAFEATLIYNDCYQSTLELNLIRAYGRERGIIYSADITSAAQYLSEDKAEESTDEVKENDDNTDTEAKSGEVE